jgi:chromosome partitioning protein
MDAMRTIVLASRKGGSGKSMLTRHLAVEMERAGHKVAIADADPMQGSTLWWKERKADSPILIETAPGMDAVAATARRMGVDFLVIDTPPSAGDTVRDAIKMADLVVIPVQPSPDDLRSVGSTVELAKDMRKRLAFVINRTKPRVRLTGQAAITLSQYGTVAPAMIADRSVYAASGIDGRTAPELEPTGDAAKEIGELWAYLSECMAEVAV